MSHAHQPTRTLSPIEQRCVETRLQQFKDDIAAAEEQSNAGIASLHREWKRRRGTGGPAFSGQDARELKDQIHTTLTKLGARLAEFFVRDVDEGADPLDLVEGTPWRNISAAFFVNIVASYIDPYDAEVSQPNAPSQSTAAADDDYDPRDAAQQILTAHRRAIEPDRAAEKIIRPDLQSWRRRT